MFLRKFKSVYNETYNYKIFYGTVQKVIMKESQGYNCISMKRTQSCCSIPPNRKKTLDTATPPDVGSFLPPLHLVSAVIVSLSLSPDADIDSLTS